MHTKAYRERENNWLVLPWCPSNHVDRLCPFSPSYSSTFCHYKRQSPVAVKTHNKMSLVNSLNFCVAFILQSFVAAVVFANHWIISYINMGVSLVCTESCMNNEGNNLESAPAQGMNRVFASLSLTLFAKVNLRSREEIKHPHNCAVVMWFSSTLRLSWLCNEKSSRFMSVSGVWWGQLNSIPPSSYFTVFVYLKIF